MQSAVQALGGETTIDTDEMRGTEVSVSLPRARLVGDQETTSGEPRYASATTRDLSSLRARLFAPTKWQDREDLRHQRCLESLTSSISRTLHSWLDMDFGIWDFEEVPEVMFVLQSDLERLEAVAKDKFNTIHKIILCSDAQAEATVNMAKPGIYSTITGPVTSSKVCAAILSQPENSEIEDSSHPSSLHGSIISYTTADTNESRDNDSSSAISIDHQTADADAVKVVRPAEQALPDRTVVRAPDTANQPRFLLVDDNAINLRVISMYSKKCSKSPSVSAGGGQEAIDAFKLASLLESDHQASNNRFDIILLDLSMPEVSGFDVAAAVRKLELDNGLRRTYIAALTGLVSDKDRAAAFAAGVDEYVTKPATLKDVQGVVANWRAASEAPP